MPTLTSSHRPHWRLALSLLAGFSLVASACGGDDKTDTSASSTTAAPDDTATTAGGAKGEALEITGVDYAYKGVPDEAAVGTELTFTNASADEVHEMVLLKVAEGEDRPLDELLKLSEAERETAATFRGATVAFPGEDAAFADGSLTLAEPGRYIMVCMIPQGADPEAYKAAVADPNSQGPPEVEGGPPHVTLGMAAELTVK